MPNRNLDVAHVGVAVRSLEEALPFYRDVLGIEPSEPEEADGARIVSLRFPGAEIELLEPVDPDGPIARFISKRGPGIHHISIQVPDVARALEACRRHGYHLVDEEPRLGAHGHRVAFVHPKSTAGILLELTD